MENKILAKVIGKEITALDVETFIRNLGPERAAQFNNEQGRKQILEELVNQNLFLADAVEKNLEETEAAQREMERMKEVVLTQLNVNNTVTAVQIDPGEIADYFAANKARYNTAESADTSHILVKTEEKCQDLYDKITKQEIEFSEAARQNSECPSKQNGGKLGLYARGQMVPEYDAVAFDLEIGEMSKPVKTQFGYHLIKLNDKKAASEAKFADIKDKLKKDLLSQKQREAYLAKIDEMKQKYQVELF